MKLLLKIPIVFVNNDKGVKHVVIDTVRLSYYFDLEPAELADLRKSGLVEQETPIKVPNLERGDGPMHVESAGSPGVRR